MKIFLVNLNQTNISLGLSPLPQVNVTECSGAREAETWPGGHQTGGPASGSCGALEGSGSPHLAGPLTPHL